MTPDPERPESYPRRILLAVTGLSPQVVTETLYALAVEAEDPFVPTEIQLITTRQGAEHARLNLLSQQIGWFHKLRTDYSLPEIAFDAERIHVIPDEAGGELDDIRTLADNARAADFITERVRALTADPDCALHVSIAGGRKTMGYYLGYALSLFGREQDRLSHVLVSAPYENNRDFYYPTPYEHAIHVVQNGKDVAYDCRRAVVDLADIPFVRLREGMPDRLLDGMTSFSAAVAEAQRALPPLSLVLEPDTRTVVAGGERLNMKRAAFAFYWMLAERCRQGRCGVHWSEDGVGQELLGYYAKLMNPASGPYEQAKKTIGRHYTKDNFDPTKSQINKLLVRALGNRFARPYLIEAREPITGTRYRRYGLGLPPEAIRVKSLSTVPVPRRSARLHESQEPHHEHVAKNAARTGRWKQKNG